MCANCVCPSVYTVVKDVEYVEADCMLLNDGGYGEAVSDRKVTFPVRVKARIWDNRLGYVSGAELIRIGFDPECVEADFEYAFHMDTEIVRAV